MHITNRTITSTQAVQAFLMGVLAVALVGFAAGCDTGGSSGEGDGDETVVPAAPSGLKATSGDTEVGLSWEAVGDADEYNVYRDTEEGVVDASGDPLDTASDTSYTDTEVENGTTYYYVVTGVADEEGDPSGEEEVTPFSSPPDRPEN